MLLEVARGAAPSQRTLDLAFRQKAKRNFRRASDALKVDKAYRHRAIGGLTALASELGPLQANLQGELNPLAPARSLHIPLIAFLVQKHGNPHKTLPPGPTKGVEITGALALPSASGNARDQAISVSQGRVAGS